MKDLAAIADSIESVNSVSNEDRARVAEILRNLPKPPKGWELTGEFRKVGGSEYGLTSNGLAMAGPISALHPILRKLEPAFVPGKLYRTGGGTLRVCLSSGGGYVCWDGRGPGSLINTSARLATDAEIGAWLGRHPIIAERIVPEYLRQKYGGAQ